MPASITLRSVKGTPLVNAEVDANFTSLLTEKFERDGTIPMVKRLQLAAATTLADGASLYFPTGTAVPTVPVNGDMWNFYDGSVGTLKFYNGTTIAEVVTSETASPTFSGDLTVEGTLTVNGATTTLNSATLLIGDNNVTIGYVPSYNDTTAEGGGITLKGSTDKTFIWNTAKDAFTSNVSLNVATGGDPTKVFKIDNVSVLSATALGTSVVSSSLTSVGTLTNLRTTSLGVGMAASGTAGRVDATNDVVAFSTSDERLKTNIRNIPNALESVMQLNGVLFDWDPSSYLAHGYEGQDTGLIAQDVIKVLPEVVTMRDNGFLAVKYEKIIGLLVESIKELAIQVELNKCTCKQGNS